MSTPLQIGSLTSLTHPPIERLESRIALTGGVSFPLYDFPEESGTRFDGEPESRAGSLVAIVGDINADGFDDFAIVAPFYHSLDGRIYVVFGNGETPPEQVPLTSLDGSNGFFIDAIPDHAVLRSVNDAGDVNGDGVDDFVVGAAQRSFLTGENGGAVYVIFGRAGGFGTSFDLASLDGSNGFRIDGEAPFRQTHIANAAGDVNGDGFADVIIGSPLFTQDSVYLVFGAAGGFPPAVDLGTLDGTNGFRIRGLGGERSFGGSVSGAGDLNADGFDDVVIGAPLASPNGEHSGSSFVVFGKAAFSAQIDAATLNGADGFRINGPKAEARAGYVSSIGDVNADGIADIVVGSASDTMSAGTGSAYFIYGKAGAFNPVLELSAVDGVTGSRITSSRITTYDRGSSVNGGLVRGVGDVSGDGIDDVLIGSRHFNGNVSAAYVVFGRVGGFGPVFLVERLDGSNGFVFSGAAGGAVASGDGGGDINGDGISDLVLGDPYSLRTGGSSGSAYVIYHAPSNAPQILDTRNATIAPGGTTAPIPFYICDPEVPADALVLSAVSSNPALIPNENIVFSGTGSERAITATALPGVMGIAVITIRVSDGELITERQIQVNVFGPEAVRDLADLDGSDGFRIDGEYAGDNAGIVSGAGDINGDGFDDFIVSTNEAHPHGAYSGAAFVVFGKPGDRSPVRELSQLNGLNGFQINGAAPFHNLGISASGIGDFNGDGFDDIIVGASGANTGDGRIGRAYILFGRAHFSAAIEVSSLDGRNGFALADAPGNRPVGRELGGAGDLNGDGYDDVLITSERAGFVLFGRAGGWAPEVALAALDGRNGFRVEGALTASESDTFVRIAAAGDVNGDGFADFGVQGNATRHIVFGHAGIFPATLVMTDITAPKGFRIDLPGFPHAAGDFNGDGIDDFVMSGGNFFTGGTVAVIYGRTAWGAVVDESVLDGIRGFRVTSGYTVPQARGDAAICSASPAGDVNRDGFGDLVFSLPSSDAGSVYLVYGSAAGPGAPTLGLADLDGTNSVRWNGPVSTVGSIGAAGDVNADGFDDFVIGAGGLDGHGPFTGGAFVVYGNGDPFPVEPAISANGRRATFTDLDGDRVTVKISTGQLQPGDFRLSHSALALPGASVFQSLSLSASAAGADLTITATPGPHGGDGLVNLGFLNAAGVDLGKVTIAGDLGRIEAGDANAATAALTRLKVHSIGVIGLANQEAGDANLASFITGDVGTIRADSATGGCALKGGIKVAEGIHDSALHIAGSLSRIETGAGMTNSTLTLRGHLQPGDLLEARALGSAEFGSALILSRILVGYDAAGLPVNADVQTGRVKVRGEWTASDLIVGAMAGPDGWRKWSSRAGSPAPWMSRIRLESWPGKSRRRRLEGSSSR